MNMIDVNHVTMKFQLTDDKVNSLKEFMVALFEHRLKYNDFTVLEDIYYCPYCKSELIYNLDDDLKRIYSEYLSLYESTVTSFEE